MDVGPSFVADPEPSELAQPADGSFDHPAEPVQARVVVGAAAREQGVIPRVHSKISRSREWYALSAVTESGLRFGALALPRTGGIASIRSSSLVPSCTSAAVSCTTVGVPRPSVKACDWTEHRYDRADRLIETRASSWGGAVAGTLTSPVKVEVHRYQHDALGRRIARTLWAPGSYGSGIPTSPKCTRTIYGGVGSTADAAVGWQLLEEQDGTGRTLATFVPSGEAATSTKSCATSTTRPPTPPPVSGTPSNPPSRRSAPLPDFVRQMSGCRAIIPCWISPSSPLPPAPERWYPTNQYVDGPSAARTGFHRPDVGRDLFILAALFDWRLTWSTL